MPRTMEVHLACTDLQRRRMFNRRSSFSVSIAVRRLTLREQPLDLRSLKAWGSRLGQCRTSKKTIQSNIEVFDIECHATYQYSHVNSCHQHVRIRHDSGCSHDDVRAYVRVNLPSSRCQTGTALLLLQFSRHKTTKDGNQNNIELSTDICNSSRHLVSGRPKRHHK